MLVVPPGFGVLAYRFALAGDPEEMIVTTGIDSTATNTGLQALANARRDDFLASITAAQMGGQWTFRGVTLRMWDGGVFEAISGRVGTGAGDPSLPSNCAFLLKKISGFAGRRNRGRMYVPFFIGSEADVDSKGRIVESQRVAIENVFRPAFHEPTDVILHSKATALAPDPPAPTPIVRLDLDPLIATQRRRMRR